MIKDWIECDNLLREIGVIDLICEEENSKLDQALLEAKNEHRKATAPLIAKKVALEAELEAFHKARRKEIEQDGKRSRELTFGVIGMRKGKPRLALAKGWKWPAVLAEVKERWAKSDLLKTLVKTKETLNKDGIKSRLDEAELETIGLQIKQGDEFYYETFPEKVRKATAA